MSEMPSVYSGEGIAEQRDQQLGDPDYGSLTSICVSIRLLQVSSRPYDSMVGRFVTASVTTAQTRCKAPTAIVTEISRA